MRDSIKNEFDFFYFEQNLNLLISFKFILDNTSTKCNYISNSILLCIHLLFFYFSRVIYN